MENTRIFITFNTRLLAAHSTPQIWTNSILTALFKNMAGFAFSFKYLCPCSEINTNGLRSFFGKATTFSSIEASAGWETSCCLTGSADVTGSAGFTTSAAQQLFRVLPFS
ncbi:MAG: hypothetical protein OQK35_04045 [Alphaproteobacteria bacterium]|nr:hypothetical protein [Alphaproteobacteria bacterium]